MERPPILLIVGVPMIVATALVGGVLWEENAFFQGGDYQITQAYWQIIYDTTTGESEQWAGGGGFSSCLNCPVLIQPGEPANITFSVTNFDKLAAHNLTGIESIVIGNLVTVSASVPFPASIGPGATLVLQATVLGPGPTPLPGVHNITYYGQIECGD
jgi:hypothetical protein